jgi:hypothetical protein
MAQVIRSGRWRASICGNGQHSASEKYSANRRKIKDILELTLEAAELQTSHSALPAMCMSDDQFRLASGSATKETIKRITGLLRNIRRGSSGSI